MLLAVVLLADLGVDPRPCGRLRRRRGSSATWVDGGPRAAHSDGRRCCSPRRGDWQVVAQPSTGVTRAIVGDGRPDLARDPQCPARTSRHDPHARRPFRGPARFSDASTSPRCVLISHPGDPLTLLGVVVFVFTRYSGCSRRSSVMATQWYRQPAGVLRRRVRVWPFTKPLVQVCLVLAASAP
ncbi:hypothetical protein QJS66_10385 [Kocuria rhizophila]|nr:hypothetical protein QJS66_10385 [Kocuria rhizophila]